MTAHFSFLIQALKKWRIKLVLWNPPLVKLFQLSVKLNQDLWTIPNFDWSTFSNFSCILHRHLGLTFYSFLSPRVIQQYETRISIIELLDFIISSSHSPQVRFLDFKINIVLYFTISPIYSIGQVDSGAAESYENQRNLTAAVFEIKRQSEARGV